METLPGLHFVTTTRLTAIGLEVPASPGELSVAVQAGRACPQPFLVGMIIRHHLLAARDRNA